MYKFVTQSTSSLHNVQVRHTMYKFVTGRDSTTVRDTVFKFVTQCTSSLHNVHVRYTMYKPVQVGEGAIERQFVTHSTVCDTMYTLVTQCTSSLHNVQTCTGK